MAQQALLKALGREQKENERLEQEIAALKREVAALSQENGQGNDEGRGGNGTAAQGAAAPPGEGNGESDRGGEGEGSELIGGMFRRLRRSMVEHETPAASTQEFTTGTIVCRNAKEDGLPGAV